MKILETPSTTRMRWTISAVAVLTAAAAILYPFLHNKAYAAQEKDAPLSAAGDQSTSLNDQIDLNVTVYNSNIAPIRDLPNLTLHAGASPLKSMQTTPTTTTPPLHSPSPPIPDN